MKFWELIKIIEEELEKNLKDKEEKDEEAIRENLRKLIEKIAKRARLNSIEIIINKKGGAHRICIYSNANIDVDNQSFDINTIPINLLKEIFKDASPKDLILSFS